MVDFYYANLVCNLIAGIAILSAILVVSVNNPVNSVLWLIVSFVSVACYLVTSGMTFMGLSYIIVYVGAIAVLFLFVVMMLNITDMNSNAGTNTGAINTSNTWPLAILIVCLAFYILYPTFASLPVTMLSVINLPLMFNSMDMINLSDVMTVDTGMTGINVMSQVQMLGMTLYTHGSLWLFLISILLMLSMLVPLALCFSS